MFDYLSKDYRPTEDESLFVWSYVPSFVICQIAPHFFGFERFLFWDVESNMAWFFIAGGVSAAFALGLCGLVNLVFWWSDRRAAKSQPAANVGSEGTVVRDHPDRAPKP